MVGVAPLMMEALPSGQEDLSVTKVTVSSKSSSCSSLNMEDPGSPPSKTTSSIKPKEIKERPAKERDKYKGERFDLFCVLVFLVDGIFTEHPVKV